MIGCHKVQYDFHMYKVETGKNNERIILLITHVQKFTYAFRLLCQFSGIGYLFFVCRLTVFRKQYPEKHPALRIIATTCVVPDSKCISFWTVIVDPGELGTLVQC